MHELSIARAIVGQVEESARQHGVTSVRRVTLRVGRLSGVVAGALQFGFDLVAPGTRCEGAELVVESDPVVVWCPVGEHTLELDTMVFRCEEHDCSTPDVLSGKDLLVVGYDTDEVVSSVWQDTDEVVSSVWQDTDDVVSSVWQDTDDVVVSS